MMLENSIKIFRDIYAYDTDLMFSDCPIKEEYKPEIPW